MPAGEHQRPGVGEQVGPLERGERREVGAEPLELVGLVGDPVDAPAAGVDDDRVADRGQSADVGSSSSASRGARRRRAGRTSTGTDHRSPIALVAPVSAVGEGGLGERAAVDSDTTGWPPWRIQESMTARTGWPLTASRAFHRSAVTVFA